MSTFLIIVVLAPALAVADACGPEEPWWCAQMLNADTCQIRISTAIDFPLAAEVEFQLRLECEELRTP